MVIVPQGKRETKIPRMILCRYTLLPLLVLSAAVGCSQNTETPTAPAPTRVASHLSVPTKFARPDPTDTPAPSATTLPTPTITATPTHKPTRAFTPVIRPTRTSTNAVNNSSVNPAVPATSLPTQTQTPIDPVQSLLNGTGACPSVSDSEYGALGIASGTTDRPADQHADLNLALRGYRVVNSYRGLVDYDGSADNNAPQLWGLFGDRRTPDISHTYQVYDWDWGSNTRADPIEDFEVTLVGFATAPGESIFTPDFGHEIGLGYVALVLYADTNRLTLEYTLNDNVTGGYTLHLEGVCVETPLLDLYRERNNAGRGSLPAVRPGQVLGHAQGSEIGVAIRDRGAFLDPRSRKDWWIGR